jgi:7 transmembrane receptor (rhodopsin family)
MSTSNTTQTVNSQRKEEEEAAKTLSMIVGSFLICWLPVTITYFVFAVTKNRQFNEEILGIFMVLSHFNSAIDPLIYAYHSEVVKFIFKFGR